MNAREQGDGARAAQPLGRLSPQPWMTAPETRAVLAALAADGAEVRFVGGCVRDALLKRPIVDVDLALARPPGRAMALLAEAGIEALPTGLDHGAITAVIGDRRFEVTSLRIDVETFGRRAAVAFTDDWSLDAARRDFTINAMSCTEDGDVYDYFDGIEDLGAGRVRFVGDAEQRISEDVLRILRFFRFYGHYGAPPPDADALAACRTCADRLSILSGDRVRIEILRTLLAPQPGEVVRLMAEAHVLTHVLPEAADFERLRQLAWLETAGLARAEVSADPVRRLAALLPDAGAARMVATRLNLSKVRGHALESALAGAAGLATALGDATALARAIRALGRARALDAALVSWAGERASAGRLSPQRTEAWIAALDQIAAFAPPEFPLKGRDALALGVPPGPAVGALLAEVEAWWEANAYAPDREQCLKRLKQAAAAGRAAG